jgi:ribosomal protein S18 acetylase RimI-like enzyme
MIRAFHSADWPQVWAMLEPVFRAGTTYAYPRDISELDAKRAWIEVPEATFVFEDEGGIKGTYYLKSNQPGPGSHIANCGYIVSQQARGKGVASALCEHSQREARSRGFLGIQFNFVVSTNYTAVRLWEKLGFAVIGTIPCGYQHAELGLVDAFIMFKDLRASSCGPALEEMKE